VKVKAVTPANPPAHAPSPRVAEAWGERSEPFRYDFRVALHDIDAAGIMFYGHLFRHAHDAYEAFMGAIGFPLERIIAAR
jgi:hypothetical protein